MKIPVNTYLAKSVLITGFAMMMAVANSASAAPAKSGYYKWTDDSGKMQFTQTPPDGKPSVFVATATGAQTASPDAEPEVKAPASAAATPGSTADGKVDGKMEVLPEKDPAKCQQANANMNSLKSKARIRLTSPDGTQRFITDEERNAQIKLAEENIGMHCGK